MTRPSCCRISSRRPTSGPTWRRSRRATRLFLPCERRGRGGPLGADSPAGRASALPLTGQRGPKPMRYQPIENHGIVGNMRSAALVGLDGSVDWLCLPRFDSPSVFGAILDAEKGGRFRIAPAAAGQLRQKQYYWPETNVLITRFLHPDGIAEVEDYMPVGPGAGPDAQLVRRVRVVRGRLPMEMECRPAFDYARARHTTEVGPHGARFDGPGLSLGLAASVPLRADG